MTSQQAVRNTVAVLITLAVAYVLYLSLNILIVLLIALIVASAIRPAIVWLTNRQIPQGLAILLVYGLLGISVFILSAVVIPPITSQLTGYITNDQRLTDQLINTQTWIEQTASQLTGTDVKLFSPDQIQKAVSDAITQLVAQLPAIAGALGSLLGDLILVVVMGVYWLTARNQAVDFVLRLFPLGRRATIESIIEETESSISTYLRGVILVATFVGVANFIILRLLSVPNAVSLAFIMGITTMLPIIGGYIGAGLSTLLALLISPLSAVIAFGSFIAVQQIETHFLTPRVMSRSVGLNPILIIVVLFVGFALGGVIGALIAVPIAGTIGILMRHLVIEPRHAETIPQVVEGGILLEPPKVPPVKEDLVIGTR